MATYVISDIHGQYDMFMGILSICIIIHFFHLLDYC